MYVVLNRFLLSHQSLDFRRVPEFFKLFYGFDLEVINPEMRDIFVFLPCRDTCPDPVHVQKQMNGCKNKHSLFNLH